VVDRIAAAGGRAVFVAGELSDRVETVAVLEQAADRLGGVTVLVNNAVASTVGRDSSIADMDDDYWEEALRVNLTAPMWLCRAAIPHMRRAGHGSIVNVSSRQAERPSRGLAAYAASKGGMNALTRAIAVDHASDNIRCNTISPGFVVNDRRDADITPERLERMEGMHLTRLGEARDIAYAAVYLACHESEYLTGINLQLDGGSSNARAERLG
jgi:NAD(P)-dependent dehydrogenase (short-subunit alcohol dehydrogenase family)